MVMTDLPRIIPQKTDESVNRHLKRASPHRVPALITQSGCFSGWLMKSITRSVFPA
jgi:hypothetical protein